MNEEENIENGLEKTVKKKSIKDKFFDFVVAVLVIVFMTGMIALIGYAYYTSIVQFIESNSLEYIYFYLGIITFILFTIISLFTSSGTLFKKLDEDNMFKFLYITIPLIFIGIAFVLLILIYILILLLTYWFIWWSIILLILLIIVLYSDSSILRKIVLVALVILTIYFLFQAKDIFEIKFQTHFDR